MVQSFDTVDEEDRNAAFDEAVGYFVVVPVVVFGAPVVIDALAGAFTVSLNEEIPALAAVRFCR